MAHWIDNADSYICPVCRYETDNPNRTHGVCPICGYVDPKDKKNNSLVAVVRCGECKFGDMCSIKEAMATSDENAYCFRGERRTNETG